MQWVGAVRPQSTMGRTKLFPDIMLMCLEREVTVKKRGTEGQNQTDENENDEALIFRLAVHLFLVPIFTCSLHYILVLCK